MEGVRKPNKNNERKILPYLYVHNTWEKKIFKITELIPKAADITSQW